jgi:hypothetical protein
LKSFELGADLAVQYFWETRALAGRSQQERAVSDPGGRAGVTAGHNMDGFAHLLDELASVNGRGLDGKVAKGATTLRRWFIELIVDAKRLECVLST